MTIPVIPHLHEVDSTLALTVQKAPRKQHTIGSCMYRTTSEEGSGEVSLLKMNKPQVSFLKLAYVHVASFIVEDERFLEWGLSGGFAAMTCDIIESCLEA